MASNRDVFKRRLERSRFSPFHFFISDSHGEKETSHDYSRGERWVRTSKHKKNIIQLRGDDDLESFQTRNSPKLVVLSGFGDSCSDKIEHSQKQTDFAIRIYRYELCSYLNSSFGIGSNNGNIIRSVARL